MAGENFLRVSNFESVEFVYKWSNWEYSNMIYFPQKVTNRLRFFLNFAWSDSSYDSPLGKFWERVVSYSRSGGARKIETLYCMMIHSSNFYIFFVYEFF